MKIKSDTSFPMNYSKQNLLQAVNIHKLQVIGMKFWLISWTEIKGNKVLVIQLCRTENLIVDLWHLVNWNMLGDNFVSFMSSIRSWRFTRCESIWLLDLTSSSLCVFTYIHIDKSICIYFYLCIGVEEYMKLDRNTLGGKKNINWNTRQHLF